MSQLQVGRVIIFAKDMARMTRFYGEVLGLERRASEDDSAEFVSFGAGAIDVALHAIAEPWAGRIEISDPPEARHGTPLKLAFSVENVAATAAELNARGASFGAVNAFGSLHLCDGLDPEGNIIQLSNR